MQVAGWGFEVSAITEGGKAYSNRDYVFRGVPAVLRGLAYTRLGGGDGAHLDVTALEAGRIYAVTASGQRNAPDLAGWTQLPAEGFHYTDRNRTALTLYCRDVKNGESLQVLQGNWSGCMLVAPALTGRQVAPAAEYSRVPGVVIDHVPKSSGMYVGSPAIAILPDGTYVASHDLFGPEAGNGKGGRTRVFNSSDRGRSWHQLTELSDVFWASLFVHRGALYLLGTTKGYGNAVIRRSDDGGHTWTQPRDEHSGLLLGDGKYHCAPVPVLEHNGRLWRGMEDSRGPGGWGSHFRAFVMSVPADADLLDASNWRVSSRLGRDPKWLSNGFGGWLEGNAVATPDGEVVDILRVDYRDPAEKAAIIRISDDGKTARFSPEDGFIEFPGGCKKFAIRFDAVAGCYWTLSNYVPACHQAYNPERARNTVALMRSVDLRHWEVRSVILYHPDPTRHGFQYLDWLIDDADLVVASRTAFDDGLGGAHNQHDANYLTFHRVPDFRTRTMADSCAAYLLHVGRTETVVEKQVTTAAYGHQLTNVGTWSPDSRGLVYDVRELDQVFDGDRIEKVDVNTGEVRVLYRSSAGAGCGVVTYHPSRPRVVFIHGPENPTADWQYAAFHRRGVLLDEAPGATLETLDARDLTPPFTPGALRGGTHVHTFSGDGRWVSFTYEDHVLNARDTSDTAGDVNQRNVGVSVPTGPVQVSRDHPRNHDGSFFTVLVSRTVRHPVPGSDQISKAFSDAWVGRDGYLKPDGTREHRAIAFQGLVTSAGGKPLAEVFIVDLPDDVTIPGDGPLGGTLTKRPQPPRGTVQRRLTFTADRRHPGLQGPRHWLRSSPDGTRIAFLMRDDAGTVQLWTVSPNGGEPAQVTRNPWDVASAFSWSPDGRQIAYAMDNSIFVTDANTGASTRLTARATDTEAPLRHACVFSPDGRKIAYMRQMPEGNRSHCQVFTVDVAE